MFGGREWRVILLICVIVNNFRCCLTQNADDGKFFMNIANAFLKSLFPQGLGNSASNQLQSQSRKFSPAFFQPQEFRESYGRSRFLSPFQDDTPRSIPQASIRESQKAEPSFNFDSPPFQLSQLGSRNTQVYQPVISTNQAPDLVGNGWAPKWGLQGRTDLPAQYVYPFAREGSRIQADRRVKIPYKLGQDLPRYPSLPPNYNKPYWPPQEQQIITNPADTPWASIDRSFNERKLASSHRDLLNSIEPEHEELFDFPESRRLTASASPRSEFSGLIQELGQNSVKDAWAPSSSVPDLPIPPRIPAESQPVRRRRPAKLRAPKLPVVRRIQTQRRVSPPRIKPVLKMEPKANESSTCPSCIYTNLLRLAGDWTQIYGSDEGLKGFSVLMALKSQSVELEPGITSLDLRPSPPSCVGLQIGRYRKRSRNLQQAPANLFFRDNSPSRHLFEMTGRMERNLTENPTGVNFDFPELMLPMCLVKLGPQRRYVVMVETTGPFKCQSYHVFAKDTDEFFRNYDSSVTAFMRKKVLEDGADTMNVLPFPELCQLT